MHNIKDSPPLRDQASPKKLFGINQSLSWNLPSIPAVEGKTPSRICLHTCMFRPHFSQKVYVSWGMGNKNIKI